MDVKSIAANREGGKEPKNREENGKQPSKPILKNETAPSQPMETPEAAEQSIRASQPVDTQTVLEMLSHRPVTKNKRAKFPTRKPSSSKAATVKKVDRTA